MAAMLIAVITPAQGQSILDLYRGQDTKITAHAADKMLETALKRQNPQEIIIGYLEVLRCKQRISRDSLPVVFNKGLSVLQALQEPGHKAVMYSVLSGILRNSHAYRDGWRESSQQDVVGDTISDISTWSDKKTHSTSIAYADSASKSYAELKKIPAYKLNFTDNSDKELTMFDVVAGDITSLLLYGYSFFPSRSGSNDIIAKLFLPSEEFLKMDFRQADNHSFILAVCAWQEIMRDVEPLKYSAKYVNTELRRIQEICNLYRYRVKDKNTLLNSVKTLAKRTENIPEGVPAQVLLVQQVLWEAERSDGSGDVKRAAVKEAKRICRQTMSKYPNAVGISQIETILDDLNNPGAAMLEIYSVYAEDPIKMDLRLKNITKTVTKIYRVCPEMEDAYVRRELTRDSLLADMDVHKLIKTQTNTFNADTVSIAINQSVMLAPLSFGVYVVEVAAVGSVPKQVCSLDPIRSIVYISNLLPISRSLKGRINAAHEIVVVDSKTGVPQFNVSADIFRKEKFIESVKSDSVGVVSAGVDYDKLNFVIKNGHDRYYPMVDFGYAHTWSSVDEVVNISGFTDRGIYRPGQRVQFSAVISSASAVSLAANVLPNREIAVFVARSMNKEDSLTTLTSDDFGVIKGEFTLPDDCEPGRYRVMFKHDKYVDQTKFEVSEYKRATFKIVQEQSRYMTNFGVPVKIAGRVESYSGASLGGAKVQLVNMRDLADQITTTNEKGEYEFNLMVEKYDDIAVGYVFGEVVATDQSGETQRQQVVIVIDCKAVRLSVSRSNFREGDNKDQPLRVRVGCNDLNDKMLDGKGVCKMYLKDDPKRVVQWEMALDSSNFEYMMDLSSLKSDRYRMEVTVNTTKGSAIDSADVILWSYADRKLPIKKDLWAPGTDFSVSNGQSVPIYIGTSLKNAHILYEVFIGDKLVERRWLQLSDSVAVFDYTYPKVGSGQVTLLFTTVHNKKVSTEMISIKQKLKYNTLKITSVSFRDRILPGGHEKWSFSVQDTSGKGQKARVFATMYDRSLDAISPYSWTFNKYRGINYGYFQPQWNESRYFPGWKFARKVVRGVRDAMGEDKGLYSQVVNYGGQAEGVLRSDDLPSFNIPQYRGKFNETAFFYPDLRTNDEGITEFEFDVPESNTEWLLNLFAFNKELDYDLYRTVSVSQKPIMVKPNMPRFLRSADAGSFGVTVINQTDSTATCMVKYELFNTQTDEVIIDGGGVACVIDAQKSKTFTFDFETPKNLKYVGIRVSAATQSHSDGEQHKLDILPVRTMVTQTENLNSMVSGQRQYVIGSMRNESPTKEDESLSLEITSNPIMMVIDALPKLVDRHTECVTGVSASLYSAVMTRYLIGKYPELESKEIITGADAGKLTKKSIKKLADLQNRNGSWSWFRGFGDSPYITLSVLDILKRVSDVGELTTDEQTKIVAMQTTAISYLDKVFLQSSPVYYDANYLKIRTDYHELVPIPRQEFSQLINLAIGDYQKQSVYTQAMLAVAFRQYGRTEEAHKIINSLRTYVTQTDEMGMWWQNNNSAHPVFSNESVICHVAVMDAFRAVDPVDKELRMMSAWLISQKQVQSWGNVPSTQAAIHAILSEFSREPNEIKVKWGNQTVKITNESVSSGYYKQTIPKEQINKKREQISVTNRGKGVVLGAVSHSYYEDFVKIKQSGTGLSVSKRILVHRPEGYVVAETTDLKVGDRIKVEFIVKNDRDMDYIVLRDARPACMECVQQLPIFEYQNGVAFRLENKDSATSVYINFLPKGTHVFNYDATIDRAGTYTSGNVVVESSLASQFRATYPGSEVVVK